MLSLNTEVGEHNDARLPNVRVFEESRCLKE
jgi:hypothetical protein